MSASQTRHVVLVTYGEPTEPAFSDQLVPPMTCGSWLIPRGCMATNSAGIMASASPAQKRRARARRMTRAR